jgi:hypothetical protein
MESGISFFPSVAQRITTHAVRCRPDLVRELSLRWRCGIGWGMGSLRVPRRQALQRRGQRLT